MGRPRGSKNKKHTNEIDEWRGATETVPTAIKDELTPQELEALTFKQLRELALNKGMDVVGMTKKDLQMALGAAPEGTVSIDLGESLTPVQVQERRIKEIRVPGRVRYWEKDEDKIWKIWEKNPEAFDGVDFTDRMAPIQHVFDRNVECVGCGTKFVIRREYYVKDVDEVGNRIKTLVIDKESETLAPFERSCPECGKKYIYHDPDKEPEVAKY